MALRVEWLGVAEGSTQDARGALALVGVNQNVIQAPILPHTMKEVIVLYVADDDGDTLTEGTDVTVDFRVESPNGTILSAARSAAKLSQKSFLAIPAVQLQFVAESLLRFEEYGTYTIRCTVETADRQSASEEKRLYVIEPAASSVQSVVVGGINQQPSDASD
jgi:hypothetical protein